MKKTLSVILTLAMVISMFAALSLSTSAADVECATWADVVAAFTADATASVKLTGDVTCDAAIETMSGTFDGNGYTVTVAADAQMFAKVTGTATIKNFQTAAAAANTKSPVIELIAGDATVVIENVINNVAVAESTAQTGGIVAKTTGSVMLTMTAVVNNADLQTVNQVSGIVGNADGKLNITFTDVVNNGKITGNKDYAGGIICSNGTVVGTMTRVINNGEVVVLPTSAKGSNAAGFVGTAKAHADIVFTDCVNTGNVTLTSTNSNNAKYGVAGFAVRCDNTGAGGAKFVFNNCINTGVVSVGDAVGLSADAIAAPNAATVTATGCSYVEGTTTITEGVAQVSADDAKTAIAAIEAKMDTPRFGKTVSDPAGKSRFNVAAAAADIYGIVKGERIDVSSFIRLNDGKTVYDDKNGGFLNKNHQSKETFAVKTASGDKNYYALAVLEFDEYISVDGFTVYGAGYKSSVLDDAADILVSADGVNWVVAYEGTDLVKDQKWIGCDYTAPNDGAADNYHTAHITADFADSYDNIKYVAYGQVTPRTNNPTYYIRFVEFEVYGSIGETEVVAPPAGDDTTSPDTGDNTIFVALALVAVACVGTVVITRKREQN